MKTSTGFTDVRSYSPGFLRLGLDGAMIAVTYRREWEDGFGARGWKPDGSMGDPAIIASTRETGDRIPTSVLVHDLLDHFLSGFTISGHRAEAMALVQLGHRTGTDIRGDYRQLVNEDLRFGRVNGESLASFLSTDMVNCISASMRSDGKTIIDELEARLGHEEMIEQLVDRFFVLGEKGRHHAQDSWRLLGLKQENSTEIGMALQHLLEKVDLAVEDAGVDQLRTTFTVGNETCAVEVENAEDAGLESRYFTMVHP